MNSSAEKRASKTTQHHSLKAPMPADLPSSEALPNQVLSLSSTLPNANVLHPFDQQDFWITDNLSIHYQEAGCLLKGPIYEEKGMHSVPHSRGSQDDISEASISSGSLGMPSDYSAHHQMP